MEIDKIVEGLDKKIVENSTIIFNRANDTQKLILNDDGVVEQYLNEKLFKSFNFSKLGLLRECKNLIQEGYSLVEADIPTQKDETEEDILDNPEQTKQNLQQDIKDVEEIQKLQDELDNKLDNLNEDLADINSDFPSTEFSSKILYVILNEMSEANLRDNLTDEQIKWIETNLNCSLGYLSEALYDLYDTFGEGLTSLDNYIADVCKFIRDNKKK